MEKFDLRIGKIEFDDGECAYRDIYVVFKQVYLNIRDTFQAKIEELFKLKDKESCLMQMDKFAKQVMNTCISEVLIDYLIQNNVYTYNLETVLDEYDVYSAWDECYGKLKNKLDAIIEKKELQYQYRELRKASRGKWQGGGFGVTGALKGAATAGILNGVTGVGHSIGNMIGNAYSEHEANKKIEQLFANTFSLVFNFVDALELDVMNLANILSDILIKNGILVKIVSQEDRDKGIRIYDNYNKIQGKENKENALIQCLKYDPYNEEYYKLYLYEFYVDTASEKEFDRMCSYFMPEIEDFKKVILRLDLVMHISKRVTLQKPINDEEELGIVEQYLDRLKRWGIEKSSIQEFERFYVYALILDTEHSEYIGNADANNDDKELLLNFNEEAEISAKDLQKILHEYRFMLKNGEYIEQSSAEDAQELLKAKIAIKQIYEKCDFASRSSVSEALTAVQQYKYEKVGEDIVRFLQCAELVTNSIFDFFIDHDDFNDDVKNFKAGRFRYSPNVIYSHEQGLVFQQQSLNSVYYVEDYDERCAILNEIKNIGELYEKMNFHDENQLNDLKGRIVNIFDKTQLGGSIIQEINKRLNYVDLYERTVLGVVYDTREEAQNERKKVSGKRKYDTEEQASFAQKELDFIEGFVIGEGGQLKLYSYIEKFLELKNRTFSTQTAIDKLNEIEEDIIQKYSEISNDVQAFKKKKSSIRRWLIFAIVGTIVGISYWGDINLVGKIIAVVIVLAIWGNFIESYEQLKSFDKNVLSEKDSIDNIIFIQNGKIYPKKSVKTGASNKSQNIDTCPNCGNPIRAQMKFCPKCGKNLKEN